jgi:multicomponent K+:H+ antiporter subunit A
MSIAFLPLIPLLAAMLPPLAIRAGRTTCTVVTAGATLVALVLLLTTAPAVFRGDVVSARHEWVPQIGLNYSLFVDGLGFFFAALILGSGC